MKLKPDVKNYSLVAFDFDGVIANTEPLHLRAKEIMIERLGARPRQDYLSFVGIDNLVFWRTIIAENNLSGVNPKDLARSLDDVIIEISEKEHLRPNEGLFQLLETLRKEGIRVAVCSSSHRPYLERMLEILGLSNQFEVIVAGDEVESKKPNPDIYLKALSITGIPAENALAIEDSTAGVTAANRAGIECVGYDNPTSGNQDLTAAKYRISSFLELQF